MCSKLLKRRFLNVHCSALLLSGRGNNRQSPKAAITSPAFTGSWELAWCQKWSVSGHKNLYPQPLEVDDIVYCRYVLNFLWNRSDLWNIPTKVIALFWEVKTKDSGSEQILNSRGGQQIEGASAPASFVRTGNHPSHVDIQWNKDIYQLFKGKVASLSLMLHEKKKDTAVKI